jgi:hypothetical protein
LKLGSNYDSIELSPNWLKFQFNNLSSKGIDIDYQPFSNLNNSSSGIGLVRQSSNPSLRNLSSSDSIAKAVCATTLVSGLIAFIVFMILLFLVALRELEAMSISRL